MLGCSGSYNVATWWRNRVGSNENNYNDEPDKLNFAMKGTLTITLSGKSYILPDFYIGQGHNWAGNNWWIGGGEYSNVGDSSINCSGLDESGNTVKLQFVGRDNDSNSFLIGKLD